MPRPPRGVLLRRTSGLIALLAVLGACAAPGLAPTSPAATATATASAGSGSATPTVEPTPPGAAAAAGLALTRPVEGVNEVFVIDPDGSARQVSGLEEPSAFHAVRPLWSPDRKQIAFLPRALGSGVDPQLWVVAADGSNQRPIADVGESIGWSPDSSRILFQDSVLTTDTTGEPARIWIVEVESADLTQFGSGDLPIWLPSGDEISYVPLRSAPGGPTFPFVVEPLSGGQPRELIRATGVWWSPDGASLLAGKEDGLYLADADGSNAERLVEGYSPVWSPDGSRIAYAYDVTDEEALPIIGVVDRDGEMIWSGAVGGDPVWSPDGTKLAVEVGYPETSIQILDGATGSLLLELEGEDPSW